MVVCGGSGKPSCSDLEVLNFLLFRLLMHDTQTSKRHKSKIPKPKDDRMIVQKLTLNNELFFVLIRLPGVVEFSSFVVNIMLKLSLFGR